MTIPREEFDRLNQLEERHWWFAGMRRIVHTLISPYLTTVGPARWLEVGCGTGYTSQWLADHFQAHLFATDLSFLAVQYARQRGIARFCQSTMVALPFATGAFDILSCLDVLEHLESREVPAALAECRRVLKLRGILLLRVPAYPRLGGFHGQRWQERQRFTARKLSGWVTDAGFEILRLTYANMFLFPIAAFKRLVLEPRKLVPKSSDLFSLASPLEWFLTLPLRAEAWLLRSLRLRLPFGLSILAIARKI